MPTKLTPADFGPEFQDKLTTQGYGGGARIEGVRLLDLRLLTDDGGSFAELVRLDESGHLEAIPDFKVRQSSYSLVLPGAIKAFHLLFGMGFKLNKIFNPVEIFNDLFVSGHCLVMFLIFATILKRRLFSLQSDLVFASIIFLAFFCVTPVFSPRYLYFVMVLWVLVLAGAPLSLRQRNEGEADPLRSVPDGSAGSPNTPTPI